MSYRAMSHTVVIEVESVVIISIEHRAILLLPSPSSFTSQSALSEVTSVLYRLEYISLYAPIDWFCVVDTTNTLKHDADGRSPMDDTLHRGKTSFPLFVIS